MGQSTYTENTLRKYGLKELKAISTPVDIGIKWKLLQTVSYVIQYCINLLLVA